MKGFVKGVAVVFVMLLVVFCAYLLENPAERQRSDQIIKNWEILWMDTFNPAMSEGELQARSGWINVDRNSPEPIKPYPNASQWIKISIPQLKYKNSAIFFEKIYGYHIIVKMGGEILYESARNYNYEVNTILLPLKSKDANNTLYIGIKSDKRIGIQKNIKIGEFNQLQNEFFKSNITDFILGSALIFIAAVMLICTFFLNTENLKSWVSLNIVILTSGTIVITYSSFLYSLFGKYGGLYVSLFDLSLFILLPAFTYFFECIFGSGMFSLITKYRKFQVVYSAFCIVLMFADQIADHRFFYIYRFATATVLGVIMIVQFILLVTVSSIYTFRGNTEAIIFSVGFVIFAVLGLGELLMFYFRSEYYDLFLWKWGVVCFLISLIIILGKKFARSHEQVVQYSKQLEMFNNELQRSEKMEIISELAASVAHEVRNPLQVTRGFLQLLAEKQQNSDKVYLNMALEELDRASGIITDFLTFAKPEAGKVTVLNVLDEFIHIEGILIPLANLQGGKISVHIPKNIYVKGNSSKFKQAFINIIKNSIESLRGEGEIQIWAYEEDQKVSIHIKDNGEGMDADVLARLGEPYFSNKTKGTGLGLMVTFRIIEVMQGMISFSSEKGVGTEATIQFPSVKMAEALPE